MKTAMQILIEWLAETEKSLSTTWPQVLKSKATELLEKEKEQIKKAYDKGTIHLTSVGTAMDGEDYYNQTYNK